jgi:hypothetical protein
MLVRWRRLVAFDLGFWTHTLVVGEDHAIAGLRAPSDDLRVAEAFFRVPYRGSVNPTPLGGMGSSRK